MLEIRLHDDYRITTDKYQYVLQERRIVKEGKAAGEEAWDIIGYYSKLEHALERFVDIRVKSSDLTSIKELIDLQRKLRKEVRSFIGMEGI